MVSLALTLRVWFILKRLVNEFIIYDISYIRWKSLLNSVFLECRCGMLWLDGCITNLFADWLDYSGVIAFTKNYKYSCFSVHFWHLRNNCSPCFFRLLIWDCGVLRVWVPVVVYRICRNQVQDVTDIYILSLLGEFYVYRIYMFVFKILIYLLVIHFMVIKQSVCFQIKIFFYSRSDLFTPSSLKYCWHFFGQIRLYMGTFKRLILFF